MLFSALCLHNMAFAFLLRPLPVTSNNSSANSNALELNQRNARESSGKVKKASRHACFGRFYHLLDKVSGASAITNWRFFLYAVYRCSTMSAFLGFHLYSIRRAIFLGLDPLQASMMLSVFGVLSTIARVIAGAIGNLRCINRQIICVASSVVAGALLSCSRFIPNTFTHNAIFHGFLGLFMGK